MRNPFLSLSRANLIFLVSVFIIVFDNSAFLNALLEVYPLTAGNAAFIVSILVLLVCLFGVVLHLVSLRRAMKPVLILVLLLSAGIAYFMDTYSIIIDKTMIQNVMETNPGEALDLFSLKLVVYIGLLGVLPSLLIYKTRLSYKSITGELKEMLISISVFSLCILVIVFGFSQYYASFFREHKALRMRINPFASIYAAEQYFLRSKNHDNVAVTTIGLDAAIASSHSHRNLVILVIGETARADHFSLNGYARETNPMLKKENIINFPRAFSCGTTTAISVPCMFSALARHDYDNDTARSTENILDVLQRAGVNVLWRDNNSDSKNVALRVTYEDFKSAGTNTMCDTECRDEGMLVGLDDYIDSHPDGDILIVLHQMGSHGPAYYKRYPKAFEKFTPVCETNQLENCSPEEIGNAYDNTILYTDYFLSRVIKLLKRHTNGFETAMLYMSDHGESLGENGLYLHGMPYFMAPEAQTHVPAIAWFSKNFQIDIDKLRAKSGDEYSHDNLFHTLLGAMKVQTALYDKTLDLLDGAGTEPY